ncbi:g2191 [Coccomyxa elongata]
MRRNAPLLAGAGVREHQRILDNALQLEDWSGAALPWCRSHASGSEGLALPLYHFSRCTSSLAALRMHISCAGTAPHLHLHTRNVPPGLLAQERPGAQETTTAEQEDFSRRWARTTPSQKSFEVRFYLVLTRLHVLKTSMTGMDLFGRILVPANHGDLLAELAAVIKAMARGLGDEDMLVCKARELKRERVA